MNKTNELYEISQLGHEMRLLKQQNEELVKSNERQWEIIQGYIRENAANSEKQTMALEHIAHSMDVYLEQWKQAIPVRLAILLMVLTAGGSIAGGAIEQFIRGLP